MDDNQKQPNSDQKPETSDQPATPVEEPKDESQVSTGDKGDQVEEQKPEEPEQLPEPKEEPELAPPTPAVKDNQSVSESAGSVDQKTSEPGDQKVTKTTDNTDSPTDRPTDIPTIEPPPPKQAAPMTAADLAPGPRPRWYVVHTYSGHEAKVAATLKQRVASQKLEDKVLDILVPTQDKIEIKEGRKNKIKEKIFPGYLLIKMVLDDNTWLVVRTTPGITSFVGMGNRPTPLPDEEVNTIQKYMTMEAPKFKTAFSVGEAVKITDGPFSEFLGSVSKIDEEKGKLEVMVSIFGRETPVELDFLQVAKL